MSHNARPSRYAISQSKARIFVGQLEPYVTEQDLYPVFSCFGKILHLNIVRHSTTVTPNEERRIPTAFVWYETTTEADAAIAALHNVFTFSSPDEEENKVRYIQVSYADKSPECTSWGKWQKTQAEIMRRTNPSGTGTGSTGMSMHMNFTPPQLGSDYTSPALNGGGGGGFTVSAGGPAMRTSQSSGALSSGRFPRNPSRGPRMPTAQMSHPQYYGSYDNLYNLGRRTQHYGALAGSGPNSGSAHHHHQHTNSGNGVSYNERNGSGDGGAAYWGAAAEMKRNLFADPNRSRHVARYTAPDPEEDLIMAAPTFTVTSGS